MNKDFKKIKDEIEYKLVKSSLGIVPGAGPFLAEFLEIVVKPPYQKRMEEWMGIVSEDIKRLEEKINNFNLEDLKENDVFISTLFHTTRVVINNHQREKIEALRNAVLNSASSTPIEEDLQLMFLNFIDVFTTWHLKILKFLDSPEKWVDKFDVIYPNWSEASPLNILFKAFPQLDDKRYFFNQVISDLISKGLLYKENINKIMKKPAFLKTSHTTDFGRQFIQFITSPFEK